MGRNGEFLTKADFDQNFKKKNQKFITLAHSACFNFNRLTFSKHYGIFQMPKNR
jgi:hypothetical protein